MISKLHFVNKIRELDYISVPLSDYLEEESVISSLRQAGCSAEEIRAFVASAKS